MKEAGRLPRILTGERRCLFAGLVANGLAQAAVLVGAALLTRYCFDSLAVERNVRADLTVMTALTAAFVCLGGGLLWLRTTERATAERLAQSYLTATRLRLFDHLNAVPSRVLQKRTRGVMMVRFVADLNALNSWISRGLARLVVAATTTIVALGVLAWLSPSTAFVVGFAVLLTAAGLLAAGPALYRRVRTVRRTRGRLAANLGEKLTAVSPVQVFGRTKGERSRLEKQSSEFAEAAVARTRLETILRTVPDGVLPIVTALVLIAAVVEAEPPTPGALLGAILIVNLLASPLRDLAQISIFWQNFRAARDILSDFLALPTLGPRGRGAATLVEGPGRLTFNDVTVAGSLHAVSVEAPPRALVAITGPSGSGKSTLLALAARLFDPDKGAVNIDGQCLAACEVMSIRETIGMVASDLPLLRGSIRRNLTYRAKNAGDEEIAETLRLCGLEGVIADLPRGLDTRVTEGGANLPAGLRQRLLLARAILGDPRLLLIDDADALGFDKAAGDALAQILSRRAATTLLVTANPSWIRMADVVWALHDGGVDVSSGTTSADATLTRSRCPRAR